MNALARPVMGPALSWNPGYWAVYGNQRWARRGAFRARRGTFSMRGLGAAIPAAPAYPVSTAAQIPAGTTSAGFDWGGLFNTITGAIGTGINVYTSLATAKANAELIKAQAQAAAKSITSGPAAPTAPAPVQAPAPAAPAASSMPAWLLPAALVGGLVLLSRK